MTKVLVVNENHIQRTPDGRCWSNGIVDYSVFKRYLDVFEEVLVAIRVKNVKQKDKDYIHLCNGKGVKILGIPDFTGALDFVKKRNRVLKRMKECCTLADCAIVRTPSAVSFQFLRIIDKKIPYALEVATNPWAWLAPGGSKSLFRPFIRFSWTKMLKDYCMKANGVAYVTKEALQKSYPCKAIKKGESKQYFTTYYSTVCIKGNLKYEAKKYEKKKSYRLIHVANAFNTYSKGHRECIEVLSRLKHTGFDVTMEFVGEGILQSEFEEYARSLSVEDKVDFIGRLNSKEDVWEALRDADLFLFPTHSEGLPRVVIESLYVGTPCVSTNVGGIPELLDDECITEVGDVDHMYAIVCDCIQNPSKMTEYSRRGIEKALEYSDDVLQKRRAVFFKKLKALCTG